METINNNINNIDMILNQSQVIFNNYLNMVKEKSQLSLQESKMIQMSYNNIILQIKNMFETLKADDISLQQIEFSINQEKKELEELYNDIAASNEENPILEVICNIHNELNSLNKLPTTTINEIQKKYFLMNNHFMKAYYYINNIKTNKNPKTW